MGISEVNNKIVDNSILVEDVHSYSREEEWVEPADPLVRKRLEWFRDQKLGLFMHWGLYSTIGVMESWLLSDEDASWSQVQLTWDEPKECQRQYKKLNRSFNPIRFNPDEWADIAKDCGFKYFILTTKHHEGFCLWDTAQTQYKTTSPDCPFSEHKYADIIKHAFNAFREKGLAIAAYFSKPDWNSPYYWAPELQNGPTARRVNYYVKEHPDLWEKFVNFTHAQLMELVEGYGPIDILWLDGGWVRARMGEDIRLEELAEKARRVQPGLLFADRTVGGPLENILTPECEVPNRPMSVPWESCITLLKKGWGYKFENDYKSAREIVHLLIDVVSKGGNLALDIGPQPDGRLPEEGVRILREMGDWLKVNGDAIYGTRICEPYSVGKWSFTGKNGVCYAIRRIDEDESMDGIEWNIPYKGVIGRIETIDNYPVKYQIAESGVKLDFKGEKQQDSIPFAKVFKIYD